jgi:hypothetical protein
MSTRTPSRCSEADPKSQEPLADSEVLASLDTTLRANVGDIIENETGPKKLSYICRSFDVNCAHNPSKFKAIKQQSSIWQIELGIIINGLKSYQSRSNDSSDIWGLHRRSIDCVIVSLARYVHQIHEELRFQR